MKLSNKNRKAQAALHKLQAESMVRDCTEDTVPTEVQNISNVITIVGIIAFVLVLIGLLS
jgi:hypothetical protein